MCKFSIIVPFYNVEKYFNQCLTSIQNQTFKDFECILIDDCGCDSSAKIAQEFVCKDKRFKIIKHDENKGLSTARNTGIDNAKGEYIFFVDSDDWISERILEKVYNAFIETKCDSIWFNTFIQKPDKISTMYKSDYILHESGYYEINPVTIVKNSSYAWNKIYKTELVKENSIRFPDGLFFEETEFYFKYFTKFKNFYYIHECLYNYRKRADSIVGKAITGDVKLLDMFDVYVRIFNYAKENNLLKEYKESLCAMLVKKINNHLLPGQHERVIKKSKETLEAINFPEVFDFM